MRKRTRRLASLLMALVLVVSLLPTAFALQACSTSGCPSGISGNNWKPYNETYHYDTCYGNNHYNFAAHSYNASNVCTGCGYSLYNYWYGNGYVGSYTCPTCNKTVNASWQYTSTTHTLVGSCGHTLNYGNHSYHTSGYCTTCGYGYYGNNYYNQCVCAAPTLTGSVTHVNESYHAQYCTTCGKYRYWAHTNNGSGYCTVCSSWISGTISSSACPNCRYDLTNVGWTWYSTSHHAKKCPYCKQTAFTQEHTLNSSGYCTTCGSYASTGTGSGVTGGNGSYNLTINPTSSVYYFTDRTALNGYSVYDLLMQDLSRYGVTTGNAAGYNITFYNSAPSVAMLYQYNSAGSSTYTTYNLSTLNSLYLTIYSYGTWSTTYEVYTGSTRVMSGTLVLNIGTATSGANIVYTAEQGKSVKLSESDFKSFWKQYINNNNGSLSYVQITGVSGVNGTLCYDHKISEKSHTNAVGSYFYTSPTGKQYDLNKLTFAPAKTNTGTATISFIAYGTTTSYSSSTTSVSGSVAITYTKGDVQDIVYNSAGTVKLDSDDFAKVYKSALGTNAGTFTIKFLELPTYGKLYSSYNSSTSYGTELTKTNYSSYTFSNSSVASDSIDRIVYVPGNSAVTDSVSYAVYSGSTLQFMGKIVFSAKELFLTYYSNSDGVRMSASDFFGTNKLSSNTTISFGTPSSGTLYRGGTAVSKSDHFSSSSSSGVYNINNVTYVPRTGYTGTVTIPLYIGSYNAGTVTIHVLDESKSFTDVTTSSWSAPYINRLYSAGIVNGTSATTFSPKANVKYGEALKMILRAAGYSEQAATDAHWASGYLSLAKRYDIVSSANVDLESYVDRTTIAEISAKALKLSKASSVNSGITAPNDTTNGYVYALYNAGIVGGTTSGGVNRFNGGDRITREEIAKIICNIMDYTA